MINAEQKTKRRAKKKKRQLGYSEERSQELENKVVVMKTEKGICTVQSTEWSDWIGLMGEREMSRMTLIFYLGQLGGRRCHEY